MQGKGKIAQALCVGAIAVLVWGSIAEAKLGVGKALGRKAKYTLTVADLEPKLADLPLGDIQFKKVKYSHIGASEYDAFFLSAAKTRGLISLNQQMTEASTKSLKKFAMSKAADEAMKENIHELVGDTPPEEWTVEQNVAVLRMAKQQDKISKDEKRYFAQTAGTMAIGTAALVKNLDTTKDLTGQGVQLQKSATKLKKTKIVSATNGLKKSLENLKEASIKGPKLVAEMKVLSSAFQALGSDE